jgi:Domain of unknown function (DUF4328)
VTTCPHCERLMNSAPDACDRYGMKSWQPVGALGPTYSVLGCGVAAIVAMWLVAFGRPVWLVYRARSDSVPSVGLFTSLMIIAELAAVVLVIVWLWRAMRNTEAFPGGGDGIGADWAVGVWFVPGVNLVLPLRILRQVTREELTGRWVAPAVWLWWISYVATSAVAFLSFGEDKPSFPVGLASVITLGVAAVGELILATSQAQQGRIDRALARRADIRPPDLAEWV